MASHFQIQKPYVLAALPRPLDPTTGRYVVSEVYGSAPGSRKRKRHELAVGIDGEAVNIYNVSSARLVTSYPVPPQSFFSCPVASIRRKVEETKEVSRYTYAATRESHENKITLFKDHLDGSSNTHSTTASVSLGPGRSIVCVAPITAPGRQESKELLVVRQDGDIVCLDAETLKKKWTSSSTALHQDLPGASKSSNFRIDFCSSMLLSDFVQGILKGSDSSLGLFPEIMQGVNADVEVLVLISSNDLRGQQSRHLHVVAVQPPSGGSTGTHRQGIIRLHALPIPSFEHNDSSVSSYRVDLLSGSLLELRGRSLTVYDLTTSLPRVTSTMELDGTTSFLRLSKTSVLCSTPTHFTIYNPVYRSLQNSVPIEPDGQTTSNTGVEPISCLLTAYFSRLELAVSVVNSNLVAIQLEAPVLRTRKRRAEGLLIDSIGRGVQLSKRPSTRTSKKIAQTSVFSNYLPGSILGDYWQSWMADEAKADALLNTNNIHGLEMLLAHKFGIQVQDEVPLSNGVETDESIQLKAASTWVWPKTRAEYPSADRRWIMYAISRAFQWNDAFSDDATVPRLICQLPESDIVNYLVDAGHLTVSNVRSALRGQLRDNEKTDTFLAEQIILRLADVDPSLELLITYISATNLGAVELLISVRTIMRSLELVQDPKKPPPKLLADGSAEAAAVNGETDAEFRNVGMELDDLEEEIQKTVSYLNEDAGIRGNGLSAAFAKLGNCPSMSMIKALRATFKPEEILSLIYLLRIELVRGSWTSRYLDAADFEKDSTFDAPPDGIVKLIADLLGRCVDAIGPGGWLLNDALLAGDEAGDFVATLKFEVSAALEGIEEAVYLRGIIGEAVKFCDASSKTSESENMVNKMKPISLHVKEPGSEALPLGLKSKDRVSSQKVVSGGEIVDRSQRETGHLRSQQVGHYSLERIAI
ncbi:hypothetical protein F4818DRAFT_421073 [Hypoxylon cercidicola]|nr:hypothetical protein F4818DRAFT_421073 [Hypoxylon cercidicola]